MFPAKPPVCGAGATPRPGSWNGATGPVASTAAPPCATTPNILRL